MNDLDLKLIYEALKFFVWGAGEGLSPLGSDPAEEPEEILFAYATETGDEDYDSYPAKLVERIRLAMINPNVWIEGQT